MKRLLEFGSTATGSSMRAFIDEKYDDISTKCLKAESTGDHPEFILQADKALTPDEKGIILLRLFLSEKSIFGIKRSSEAKGKNKSYKIYRRNLSDEIIAAFLSRAGGEKITSPGQKRAVLF
jgi:hypothetical protein